MRKYIIDLTNHLIRKNRYDEIFHRIGNPDAFVQHVKFDLCFGDVGAMNPETLGRIMCSFEIGDVMVGKKDLFDGVCFGGDCEDMFRELVSLCLAYAIRDQFNRQCSTATPRWKKQTTESQTTKKCPPLDPGTEVKTTQPNMGMRHEWTEEGWASKKWGVRGRILGHHDSHGLCYVVRHDDGTEGCYDPSELEVIKP